MSDYTWSQALDDAGWHPDYHDSDTQHDENLQAIADDQALQQHPDVAAAATRAAAAVQGGSRAEDEIHAEYHRDDALLQTWKDGNAFSDPGWWDVYSASPGVVPGTDEEHHITEGDAKSGNKRRESWQVQHASHEVSDAYAGGAFTAFAAATTAAVTGATVPAAGTDGGGGATAGENVDYTVVLPTLTRAADLVQQCIGEFGATASALSGAVESAAKEVGQHHEQDMVEQFNDFANYAFDLMLSLQDVGDALNGLHTLTVQTHDNYENNEQDAAAGQQAQGAGR